MKTPIIPILAAIEVKIVLPFLVIKLLNDNFNAVKKLIDVFASFLLLHKDKLFIFN